MPEISLPSRSASGTPRRLMPTSARSSLPLLFSTISWARRTSVRSISEADISLPLVRREVLLLASLMVLSRGRLSVLVAFVDVISRRMIRGVAAPGQVVEKWNVIPPLAPGLKMLGLPPGFRRSRLMKGRLDLRPAAAGQQAGPRAPPATAKRRSARSEAQGPANTSRRVLPGEQQPCFHQRDGLCASTPMAAHCWLIC